MDICEKDKDLNSREKCIFLVKIIYIFVSVLFLF